MFMNTLILAQRPLAKERKTKDVREIHVQTNETKTKENKIPNHKMLPF